MAMIIAMFVVVVVFGLLWVFFFCLILMGCGGCRLIGGG